MTKYKTRFVESEKEELFIEFTKMIKNSNFLSLINFLSLLSYIWGFLILHKNNQTSFITMELSFGGNPFLPSTPLFLELFLKSMARTSAKNSTVVTMGNEAATHTKTCAAGWGVGERGGDIHRKTQKVCEQAAYVCSENQFFQHY